ncbi:MAG: hypothetical protein QMD76_00860 [Anaerosomatales bacterium]|nr:hypothetical protein [Anaerosomatales bacterium]
MRARSALVLLLTFSVALAVVAGATGCSRHSKADEAVQPLPNSATSAEATATAGSGEASSAPADEATATGSDREAIIRELDAIERELSGMDLPSETDFDSLEGDIR